MNVQSEYNREENLLQRDDQDEEAKRFDWNM